MASTESNTSKESPFFALKPVVVFDVVSIGEERVQGEERECVEMRPERKRVS